MSLRPVQGSRSRSLSQISNRPSSEGSKTDQTLRKTVSEGNLHKTKGGPKTEDNSTQTTTTQQTGSIQGTGGGTGISNSPQPKVQQDGFQTSLDGKFKDSSLQPEFPVGGGLQIEKAPRTMSPAKQKALERLRSKTNKAGTDALRLDSSEVERHKQKDPNFVVRDPNQIQTKDLIEKYQKHEKGTSPQYVQVSPDPKTGQKETFEGRRKVSPEWMNPNGMNDPLYGYPSGWSPQNVTAYLSEEQKKQHQVQFEPSGTGGTGPSTTNLKEGTHIFVMDKDGEMYGRNTKEVAQQGNGGSVNLHVHHSSFLKGKAVAGAGEMVVGKGGDLKELNNRSGHYQPGLDQAMQTIDSLDKKGVDLRNTKLGHFDKDGNYTQGMVEELRKAGGSESLFKARHDLVNSIKDPDPVAGTKTCQAELRSSLGDVTARIEKLLQKRPESDPAVPGLKSLLGKVQDLIGQLESGQKLLDVANSAKSLCSEIQSTGKAIKDSKLTDLGQTTARDAEELEKAASWWRRSESDPPRRSEIDPPWPGCTGGAVSVQDQRPQLLLRRSGYSCSVSLLSVV